MARQPVLEHFIVGGGWRGHEFEPTRFQAVPARIQVIANQCDVLNALAVVCHQEFFDLPGALGGFLIQGNANFAVRRGQCLGQQARVFTLDVEITNLPKIENRFVEIGPVLHAAAIDVVRQMIDSSEPASLGVPVHALEELEIDVVDRIAFLVSIDEIQRCAANAFDGRQTQLHRTGRDVEWLCTELQGARIGQVGVPDAKRHAAGRGTVLFCKISGVAFRLFVQNEIDVALRIKRHFLGTMSCYGRETKQFEYRLQNTRLR